MYYFFLRLPYGVDSRSVDLVWSCLSEIDQYRIMQELFWAWETHENKEEMRSFLQLSVYLSHNNRFIYFLNYPIDLFVFQTQFIVAQTKNLIFLGVYLKNNNLDICLCGELDLYFQYSLHSQLLLF